MRDAADLDARAIVLQRVLEATLHRAIVARLFHVDEVDDDEACQIAQAQLASDLVGGLQIGAQRRVLDIVLARRATRVHVDRDQRFRLVDDEIAAGLQRHLRREHRVELRLHARLHEHALRLAPHAHVARVARHQQPHEVLGFAEACFAGDDDFVDLLVVEVADGALDQRTLLVDEHRRRRAQRRFAHRLPHAHQIFEVAAHFLPGARGARRTQDHAHAVRHVEILCDRLEALAVARVGDLARNAAATRGIRHQHGIAAGERQIGRQRRALVAALFLHDLDQQHLPALDHFLNLVLPAQPRLTSRHFLHRVAADLLDVLFLVLFLVVGGFVVAFLDPARLHFVIRRFPGFPGVRSGVAFGNRGVALLVDRERMRAFLRSGLVGFHRRGLFRGLLGQDFPRLGSRLRLDGGDDDRFGTGDRFSLGDRLGIGVRFDRGHFARDRLGGVRRDFRVLVVGRGFDRRGLVAVQRRGLGNLFVGVRLTTRLAVTAATAAAAAGTLLLFLLLGVRGGFFLEQRLTIRDRDLIIVGVDFGEGEKAVPVAAVVDEGGLQGRFDPGDLGEIDIAAQRLLGGGFEIEFFDAITSEHHHPGFFRMGCVDQHFVGHCRLFGAFRRAAPHVLLGPSAAEAGVRGSAVELSRAMFEDEERLKTWAGARCRARRRFRKKSGTDPVERLPQRRQAS